MSVFLWLKLQLILVNDESIEGRVKFEVALRSILNFKIEKLCRPWSIILAELVTCEEDFSTHRQRRKIH